VKEQTIEIPTSAGRMETYITRPEQDGPFPVVILYMDIWGIREILFDLASRVATVGYYVLLPDFYYRQGRVRTDFRDADGRAISLKNLSDEQQEKALAPLKKLADATVIEDTGAVLNFLDREKDAQPGPIGGFGYCMGGRHVLEAAAAFPARFRASASLHGTTLISARPESPHLSVGKFQGEVYCGFPEVDEYAPPAMVKQWNDIMRTSTARYRQEVHRGAEHGHGLPDRDLYHKRGAERDWEHIFAMFHRQIPAYSTI
jgi:carboxymethylenebutenolidase